MQEDRSNDLRCLARRNNVLQLPSYKRIQGNVYVIQCRLISSNDWPKFNYLNINLPDALNEIISEFEVEFRKSAENKHKELTWIN